ncbi:MAG: flagellar hook capping FlgD N-terminal domain-containing protein [Thermodesulfobacteriota bacterium]|nr:flagellar hook capping FlgD N-terminal domain-containing protein [Thermodesulfobacteriota bacterium]
MSLSVDAVATEGSELFASNSSVLDKDAFLNLLVTQLQYQNPLEPMESTEFTAQLAQFSSLEELANVNESLQVIQLYQASLNNSQAVAFIGKNVEAWGNTIQLHDGVSDEIIFELGEDAANVLVHIYNSEGNLTKTLDAGALNAGEQTIVWDGTDLDGNEVTDGKYTFEIQASDISGEMVDVTTFIRGMVSGVTFKEGVAYLLAGDNEIPIGNVIEVSKD